MSKWYYTKDGQRQGPVTSERLKELAANGQLSPTDLVWKEGTSQWVEAQQVKGLFPEKPIAPPPAPPPLPVGPPAIPTTPSGMQAPPAVFPASQQAVAPPLWHPWCLGAWSLLFSWAFGAFLLARNWKALGEVAKAKRAMIWFYSFFPWLLVAALTPNTPSVAKSIGFVPLAVLVAFFWLEIKPQINFVKERFDDQFPRKSWWKPVGLTTGVLASLFVAYVVVFVAVAMSEDELNTAFVKEGRLSAYPNMPVGQAVDSFLSDPVWEAGEDSGGKECVVVRGGAQLKGKPIQVALQFRVDRKSGNFEVNALEIDDRPQNKLVMVGLLDKIFGSTSMAANTSTTEDTGLDSGRGHVRTGTSVDDAEFERIRIGMTKAQVEAILGPGQEYSRFDCERWTAVNVAYKTENYTITIVYMAGKVSSKQRYPK
jgi:hypothetical protein